MMKPFCPLRGRVQIHSSVILGSVIGLSNLFDSRRAPFLIDRDDEVEVQAYSAVT